MSEDAKHTGPGWLGHLAGYWLVFLFAFCLGIFLWEREYWPHDLVMGVGEFLAGSDDEELGVADKLRNDLGGIPVRHIVTPREPFDRERAWRVLDDLPLREERAAPLVWVADEAPAGYRLIHGTFAFEDRLHGVLLLGPDGDVVRRWPITQEGVDWTHRPDTNVVPHGIAVTPEGSLIYAFDGGTSLRRVSWCGDTEWVTMGGFHHSVDLNEDGQLWTWGQVKRDAPFGAFMIRVDPATGDVLETMHLKKVIDANPDIDIFSIRQRDNNNESRYLEDAWHVNDLEALPTSLAAAFPGFAPGDLMASYRNLDLVFVMDPETLRVKWWRQGLVRRQHDPDFNTAGTISIYDNNMHRGLSRIVQIDPETFEHRTVLAGEDHGFYSWRRGKHQALPDGGWLVTSSEQGRVFEVGPDGEIRFEFLNVFDEKKLLTLAEAIWLPEDFVAAMPACAGP